MAGLTATFDAVTALLDATDLGVKSLFGGEHLSDAGAPPRIVWEPTSDSFGPPDQRGSLRSDARALHTARSAVDVHLWGADAAATLDLRDTFVQALRTVVGANYDLSGATWVGQQNMAKGRKYVLSLTINIPIPEATPTTVKVTAEDQTDIAFTIPAAR